FRYSEGMSRLRSFGLALACCFAMAFTACRRDTENGSAPAPAASIITADPVDVPMEGRPADAARREPEASDIGARRDAGKPDPPRRRPNTECACPPDDRLCSCL